MLSTVSEGTRFSGCLNSQESKDMLACKANCHRFLCRFRQESAKPSHVLKLQQDMNSNFSDMAAKLMCASRERLADKRRALVIFLLRFALSNFSFSARTTTQTVFCVYLTFRVWSSTSSVIAGLSLRSRLFLRGLRRSVPRHGIPGHTCKCEIELNLGC